MKKIIYARALDGRLCIVHPVINTYPERERITEDEALERAKKDIPLDAVNVQIVEESAIPQDRTFRNAWAANNGEISHDMQKCRDLQRARIREARAPLLRSLDAEYFKALESGDSEKVKDIVSRKKVLRDAPADPSLDAASTVDELKNIWPGF